MSSYLMDSSVLIHLARNNAKVRDHLDQFLRDGQELVICEPVAMKVLAGVAPVKVAVAEAAINSFRSVHVDNNRDFRAAAYLYATLVARGRTPRGTMDCLIAQVALSSGATLLHADRDFEAIAEVTDLQQVRIAVA